MISRNRYHQGLNERWFGRLVSQTESLGSRQITCVGIKRYSHLLKYCFDEVNRKAAFLNKNIPNDFIVDCVDLFIMRI